MVEVYKAKNVECHLFLYEEQLKINDLGSVSNNEHRRVIENENPFYKQTFVYMCCLKPSLIPNYLLFLRLIRLTSASVSAFSYCSPTLSECWPCSFQVLRMGSREVKLEIAAPENGNKSSVRSFEKL